MWETDGLAPNQFLAWELPPDFGRGFNLAPQSVSIEVSIEALEQLQLH